MCSSCMNKTINHTFFKDKVWFNEQIKEFVITNVLSRTFNQSINKDVVLKSNNLNLEILDEDLILTIDGENYELLPIEGYMYDICLSLIHL